MKKVLVLCLISLSFAVSACSSGRLPPPNTAQRVILNYFKKYAKKYPDTSFGQFHVTKAEVISMQEIHKHSVGMDAFITLGNGDLRKINATLEKRGLMWRFISWENPGGS